MNILTLKREFLLTGKNVMDILMSEAQGVFHRTAWTDKRQARYYMRLQKHA